MTRIAEPIIRHVRERAIILGLTLPGERTRHNASKTSRKFWRVHWRFALNNPGLIKKQMGCILEEVILTHAVLLRTLGQFSDQCVTRIKFEYTGCAVL